MTEVVDQIRKKIKEAKKINKKCTDLDLSEINIGEFTPEINAAIKEF